MNLLRPDEAAKKLKICKKTAYELIAKGAIPAFRVGHQWRVNEDALERLMRGEAGEERVSESQSEPQEQPQAA